jgi:hypothetical protein
METTMVVISAIEKKVMDAATADSRCLEIALFIGRYTDIMAPISNATTINPMDVCIAPLRYAV